MHIHILYQVIILYNILHVDECLIIIISIIIYNDYIIQYIVAYTSFVVSHKKLFTIIGMRSKNTQTT